MENQLTTYKDKLKTLSQEFEMEMGLIVNKYSENQ